MSSNIEPDYHILTIVCTHAIRHVPPKLFRCPVSVLSNFLDSCLCTGDWSCLYLMFHLPEQAYRFFLFVSAFGNDRFRLPESGRSLGYYLNTGCKRRALSSPGHMRARSHIYTFPFSLLSHLLVGVVHSANDMGECLSLRASCIHGRANYRPKHYWDCIFGHGVLNGFLFPPWSKGYRGDG